MTKEIKVQKSLQNKLEQYGSAEHLVEALAGKRCYKSKMKDKLLWIKDSNQTENRSQRKRSEANVILLLNLRLKQDSSKRIRKKGLIRVENDQHLLEQVIALGCMLGQWNKHFIR